MNERFLEQKMFAVRLLKKKNHLPENISVFLYDNDFNKG